MFHARIALNYDPFGAKEQHLLGAIYFKLGDYKSGLKAWKISFQLDPPGPNKIEDMGKACAEVGDKLVNPMLRQQMFNEVIDFLHQLQELMENHPLNDNEQGQYVTRLEAIHYYIGVFYGELLEFEKAVYHLRISLKLNDKELRVYNQLGWTFLDMKLIDKAEAVFREAKEIYKNSTKEKKNLFEEINFGLILCQINQSASFTYNTDLEGLLEEAFKRIQPLKNLDIKKRLLSLFHECRGQMALKKIRGKASLKIILSNRYKEPIKDFEQSITYKPTARVYYYLAGCYCQYAQMVAPKKRHRLIHNARRAADLCISHDTRGQYKDAVLLWFGPPEAGTVAVSSTPRDNKSP